MAHNHGYLCETHEVITQDGFVLSVHRLPGGRVSKKNASLTPVLLQHGLLDSSADWLIAGPGKALGYVLADQGYDVWMGNARGNIYSRKHQTLHPDNTRFWDWTWHEMGTYDLPAVIDHILNVTGHRQIYYVGHSMGTTMFFVLCSKRPEYNGKVKYMAAMAPVAYMLHTTSPIRYLSRFAHSFEIIYDYFGHGQFLPRNQFVDDILKAACEMFEFEEKICENWLFVICGHDPAQFEKKLLPLILGHNPAGTSTKTLVHYAQEIKSGKFQQFDYGSSKNLVKYNTTDPPQYNLSLVTVPISLHCGDNDLLANLLDVQELFKGLAQPVGMYLVNFKGWNHLDFLWGRDAPTLVYDQIDKLFRRYSHPVEF
ncbi:lipase 1-like [Macrosteles quadrilineatus]|uniref:lipase 1-like n=1 Tax=Macrosteles quadrilineatus TaxID=74068 RepID=UPI0023E20DDC|nr:lipase 1-like [Macrosteles quadrilineatus]